jgi:hypothetical protein
MLLFFPAVHQRAVRLTRRDLIDATPLTAKEIQAEKDQLRAQFAFRCVGSNSIWSRCASRRRSAPPTGRMRNCWLAASDPG